MILVAIVLAQVAVTQAQPVDSIYASDALRRLVLAASLVNRAPPAALNAYRAHIETEVGFLVVDSLGRENTGQIEQLGSTATWARDSGYDVHVVGYRTQSAGGFPISMVGLLKSLTIPMLVGERIPVGVELLVDSTSRAGRQGNKLLALRTLSSLAVHPFAVDRDSYYRFAGGDTIAVVHTSTRRIPVVRIRVMPRMVADSPLAAFDGEVDIDADRFEIVRMRGQFVVNKPPKQSLLERVAIAATGTEVVGYVEYVNAEHDGRYWLPTTQRFEAQARIAMMGGVRPVLRILSHFSDVTIDDTAHTPNDSTSANQAYLLRRVTFAPSDSMSRYRGWSQAPGSASGSVAADDFDDIAPPAWKGQGAPKFTFYPSRPGRIVHYDRVEGLFTGAELSLEARGAAPGVVVRFHGGWAWAERTPRGGVTLMQTRKTSRSELQIDRSLVTTGEFTNAQLDGGSSFGAFFASVEDMSYVDRWSTSIAHTRIFGGIDRAFATFRLAAARDVDADASLAHGPVLESVLFAPNRHATTGSYALAAADYEVHPSVSGEFLDPGVGGALHVEVAGGQLSWLRTVATLSARKYVGPVALTARLRGGAVFSGHGALPPQTLFELGGGGGGGGGSSGGLSGYKPGEFAGDRAAVFRTFARYGFPLFRAPHRVGWLLIPGLSPGLVAGAEGDWTEISNATAQDAVYARGDGTVANAFAHATGGVKSTAAFGFTLFNGSISFGVARPIGQVARWRWVIGIG